MHHACENGQFEIDIDFNVVDQGGMTPLHHACDNG